MLQLHAGLAGSSSARLAAYPISRFRYGQPPALQPVLLHGPALDRQLNEITGTGKHNA